jgi:hypothetical protein
LRADIFGPAKLIEPSKRANWCLDRIRQMRALFEAVVVRDVDAKEATDTGIKPGLQRIREITKTAEREIHAVVVACTTVARLPTIDPALQ